MDITQSPWSLVYVLEFWDTAVANPLWNWLSWNRNFRINDLVVVMILSGLIGVLFQAAAGFRHPERLAVGEFICRCVFYYSIGFFAPLVITAALLLMLLELPLFLLYFLTGGMFVLVSVGTFIMLKSLTKTHISPNGPTSFIR